MPGRADMAPREGRLLHLLASTLHPSGGRAESPEQTSDDHQSRVTWAQKSLAPSHCGSCNARRSVALASPAMQRRAGMHTNAMPAAEVGTRPKRTRIAETQCPAVAGIAKSRSGA